MQKSLYKTVFLSFPSSILLSLVSSWPFKHIFAKSSWQYECLYKPNVQNLFQVKSIAKSCDWSKDINQNLENHLSIKNCIVHLSLNGYINIIFLNCLQCINRVIISDWYKIHIYILGKSRFSKFSFLRFQTGIYKFAKQKCSFIRLNQRTK